MQSQLGLSIRCSRKLNARRVLATDAAPDAQVLVSLAAVAAFILVGWPAIIATTGWVGFLKFWVVPWLG